MKQFMSDPQLVDRILGNILMAIERIERRFDGIETAEDFMTDDDGIDRLDGITMMLIAMGEQLKRLDKVLYVPLDARYPHIDWKGAKGIRDILSHQYFSIDMEIVFHVCQNEIERMRDALVDMKSSLN